MDDEAKEQLLRVIIGAGGKIFEKMCVGHEVYPKQIRISLRWDTSDGVKLRAENHSVG